MKRDENWSIGKYAVQVHKHLLYKESKMMPFLGQSPQLSLRVPLVDYTIGICSKMGLCTEVKHLAVYYLDLFMDNHVIVPEHMCLIAAGCAIVAVKVDGQDILIPKMSDFNAILGSVYQLAEIVDIESSIMQFFNWDLLIPTAATFVQYYSLYAVSQSDCHCGIPLLCTNEAKKHAKQYISYFLDTTLKDYRYRMFHPSVVAASCVAAMRICLELTPVWPQSLEIVTQSKFSNLRSCIELMFETWNFYCTMPINKQSQPLNKNKRKRSITCESFSPVKRNGEFII